MALGEQRRVEADRVALAFEHGALEVVVEHDPGTAVECGEGLDVAAQEAVHARVQEEAQEDHARVAQHHDEGHQRAACAADLQMAEVAPVALHLLARQRAQAQIGLGDRTRAHAGDEVAEVLAAAAVATLADHAEQPHGSEFGELGEGLQDERPVHIDPARAQR